MSFTCRIPKSKFEDEKSSDIIKGIAKRLYENKQNLNIIKSELDPLANDREFSIQSLKYESVTSLKNQLKRRLGDKHISGAWLKYYEILMSSGIMQRNADKIPISTSTFAKTQTEIKTQTEEKKQTASINMFFNGELPGSGVLAAYHLAHTKFDTCISWIASSLLPESDANGTALGDEYWLAKLNPAHWIMTPEYPGDITSMKDQNRWRIEFNATADIYMSDAAGEVHDYNNQELEHTKILAGTVLAGLHILREGGDMVVKLFTMFEPITISIIGALSVVFEKCHLFKPIASKMDNSEIYFIGLGYQPKKRLIKCLKDVIKGKHSINEPIPLVVNDDVYEAIYQAQVNLAEQQGSKIYTNIDAYQAYKRGENKEHESIAKLEHQKKTEMDTWFRNYSVSKLPESERLCTKQSQDYSANPSINRNRRHWTKDYDQN